ncbi:MAG: hypothetical protein AAGB46_06075 [Verrucomicrobiota bacterium]
MPTNPIPKGTKNLSINVPKELHAALKQQADDAKLSLSAYVRRILELAQQKKLRLQLSYKIDEGIRPLTVAEPDRKNKKS